MHVSLLGDDKLADVVPRRFGAWTSHDVSDLVAPKTEDSLSARLYSQTVGRTYLNTETGAEVMALIAHGDTQSNSLQLHRPRSATRRSASRSPPIGSFGCTWRAAR